MTATHAYPELKEDKSHVSGHFGVLQISATHRATHPDITLHNGLLVAVKPQNGQEYDLGIIWCLRDHFSSHLGVLWLPATHRAA